MTLRLLSRRRRLIRGPVSIVVGDVVVVSIAVHDLISIESKSCSQDTKALGHEAMDLLHNDDDPNL